MASINDFNDNHTVHALLTELANDDKFNNDLFKGKTLGQIYNLVSEYDDKPSFFGNLERLVNFNCGNFVYHDCTSSESGFDGIVFDDGYGHRIFLLAGTSVENIEGFTKDAASDILEQSGVADEQIKDLEDFYQKNKGNPPNVHLYGNSKGGYEAEWLYVNYPEEVEHCYVINALPLKYEELSNTQKELLKNSSRFTCIIVMDEQGPQALDYVPFLNNIVGYRDNIKFVKSKSSKALIGAHSPGSIIDGNDHIEFLESSSCEVVAYFAMLCFAIHGILGAALSARIVSNIISGFKSLLKDKRIEIDVDRFYQLADMITHVNKSLHLIDEKIRNLYSEGLRDLAVIVKKEIIAWQIYHLTDVQNYLRFSANRFLEAENKIKNWDLN